MNAFPLQCRESIFFIIQQYFILISLDVSISLKNGNYLGQFTIKGLFSKAATILWNTLIPCLRTVEI